jgi:hypothetical protein
MVWLFGKGGQPHTGDDISQEQFNSAYGDSGHYDKFK